MKQPFSLFAILFVAFSAFGQTDTISTKEFKNYTETAAGGTIDMIAIKGGTFTMGSPESESGKHSYEKQHTVTVSDFYMSKTEVSFEHYDAFCNATGRSKPIDEGWGRGTRPVINVSWDDATAYCAWLSTQTGKNYRLPTEAEWEYACRAGTTSPFNTGNELTTSQANFDYTIDKTTPVGSYSPNEWGLYDMHGNVWEWCSDWFNNYSTEAQTNPLGPLSGWYRVGRGGSWSSDARGCRSADRSINTPTLCSSDLGFRMVCFQDD